MAQKKDKSASDILLEDSRRRKRPGAGGGLLPFQQLSENNRKKSNKPSLFQKYGGTAATLGAGYLGYKLDKARGGSGVKGALLGGGAILAARKLGVGKTLALTAASGAAYFAYKKMPQGVKDKFSGMKVPFTGGKSISDLKMKALNSNLAQTLRTEMPKRIRAAASNFMKYEVRQGMKSTLHGMMGKGPLTGAIATQLSQMVAPSVSGGITESFKNSKVGKGVNQFIETVGEKTGNAVDKAKEKAIDSAAKKDPNVRKNLELMKTRNRDKEALNTAVKDVYAYRKTKKDLTKEFKPDRNELAKQGKFGPQAKALAEQGKLDDKNFNSVVDKKQSRQVLKAERERLKKSGNAFAAKKELQKRSFGKAEERIKKDYLKGKDVQGSLADKEKALLERKKEVQEGKYKSGSRFEKVLNKGGPSGTSASAQSASSAPAKAAATKSSKVPAKKAKIVKTKTPKAAKIGKKLI